MHFFITLFLSFFMVMQPVFAASTTPANAPTYETYNIAPELKIIHILPSVYVIEDQGGIPSYSMLVDISDDQLLLVDTTSPEKTKSVLEWVNKKFTDKTIVAINTHHHWDRTGGNQVLFEQKIPVYGSDLTASLAKEEKEIAPNHTFPASEGKVLNFDDKQVKSYL